MYSPQAFHPVLEVLEDRTAFAVDVVTSPAGAPAAPVTSPAPAQQAPAFTTAGQGTNTQAANAQAASGQTNNAQFANGQNAGGTFFNNPSGTTQGTNAVNPNAQIVNGQTVVNGQLVNGQTAAGVNTNGLGTGTLLREIVPQPSVVQTLGTTSSTVPTIEDAPPASFVQQGPPPPTAQIPSSFPGRIVLTGTGVQQRVAFGNGPFTQAPGLYQVGGGGGDENLPVPTQRQQRPAPQLVPLSAPGEALTLSVSHEQADGDADVAWQLPPAPDDR